MNNLHRFSRFAPVRWTPAVVAAFVAGCGGGNLDPILGSSVVGQSPTVTATSPSATTPIVTGVAINSQVSATFSKPMAAATLTSSSFTLACPTGTPITSSVSYDATTKVATLAPAAPLPSSTTCMATVTTAAQDTLGLPLASNFSWSFVTGDFVPPTVIVVSPAGLACLTRSPSATFSEPMDPTTINSSTFTVSDNGVAVPGSVSYDPASRTASFTATNPAGFAASSSYVVTVKSGSTGVKDTAGNPLVVDSVSGFTTGTQACVAGVALNSAASFGAFGGNAGVTNQGVNTVIGGNVGTTAACTLITGLHDASNVYTETTGQNIGAVSGSIACGPPAPGTTTTLATATQARADAQAAYNALAALPAGSDPGGQLANLTLMPGVYKSAGGTFDITGGNLKLDAQGDANAVWVFQSDAGLTVGLSATPSSVLLIGGAQAKNVYWKVGSAARIEDGSTMIGTIIAPAGVTVSTAGQMAQTTLTGRAIGLTASVTLVNTTIVAP